MRDFKAEYLPTWLINQVVLKRGEGEDPFPWATTWVKSALRARPARNERVRQVMAHTVNTLAAHAHSAYRGRVSQPKFIELCLVTLFDGAVRSYLAGAHQHDSSFQMGSGVRTKMTNRIAQQSTWLENLYDTSRELATLEKAAASAWLSDNPSMAQRLALYTGTLHGAHQQGELDGWTSAHNESPIIVWHAQGHPPCINCAARDGIEFTVDNLPDFPGDGMFGSFSCLGGPSCSCFLTFEPSGVPLGAPGLPQVGSIPGVPIP